MRRIVLASIFLLACGDDDTPSGDTGASNGTTTTVTTATTGETVGSSEASSTTAPGDTSTTSAGSSSESSSSSTGDPCASASCADCFECTYDDLCADEHSACSIDPQCSVALICVRDCLEQSPDDPATCVAMCECPADGPFQALLTCATGVCVPDGSCPALAC